MLLSTGGKRERVIQTSDFEEHILDCMNKNPVVINKTCSGRVTCHAHDCLA